jgi:hypothetical protein
LIATAIKVRTCGRFYVAGQPCNFRRSIGRRGGRRHAMELKFSHVDVRVKNLEETCAYYAQILKARIKKRSLIPTDKLTAGVAL